RIYREDKSVSTEENLSFSSKIIKENSLPEDITIITDGYHQLRADMLAERLGIKAYNISAHTSRWLVPTYWVREWFGVAYYIVRR
ncbi:MAG: YdcF family protein, partial [Ruminococcus sp.]|nr:YdcF family protein [Ruminococcus sp.]